MTTCKPLSSALKLSALMAIYFATGQMVYAVPKPAISKLSYNVAAHKLEISGKATTIVNLFDAVADQWLASATPVNGKFSFSLADLPVKPCSVRVEAGGASVVGKLTKTPGCLKGDLPPVCKIDTPSADQSIKFGETLNFSATATDPDGTVLYYEWDFGGGASARPNTSSVSNIKFDARDNTAYNVSFIATDLTGRRCVDRVNVTVGIPPAAPDKVPEQAKAANGADSTEHVVLPFTPFSMEFHDLTYKGMSQMYPISWLNAVVLKKGSVGAKDKPAFLKKNDVQLSFTAASNPRDPVGFGSINSTSQNYPVNKSYSAASIKKTDYFDPCEYTGVTYKDSRVTVKGEPLGTVAGSNHPVTKASCSFGAMNKFSLTGTDKTFGAVEILPDEGQQFYDPAPWSKWNEVPPGSDHWVQTFFGYNPPNGVAMPGVIDPYMANEPQAFNAFNADKNVFAANGIALFPTDDQGRHNAYPVMRVQAEADGKVLATGDAVMGVSTEFNCAECHTYGKIGADQAIYDKLKADVETSAAGSALEKYKPFVDHIPQFVKPEDIDPTRKAERDVIEQAAMLNVAKLHDFIYGFARILNAQKPWPGDNMTLMGNGGVPSACGAYCHRSDPKVNETWGPMTVGLTNNKGEAKIGLGGACPEYSNSLHNTHGRMLGKLNSDFTGNVKRDPVNQSFTMADLTKKADPEHPFLLEVKDSGTPESSCLFCHQGKQDKYQRDVMTAAGVNCIDCHGDMAVLAGGSAMATRSTGPKDSINPPDNNGTTSFEHLPRHSYRDGLPSCAACHTGIGEEPVLRRSYDMTSGKFKILAAKNERFAENLTPKITDEVLPNSNNTFKSVEVEKDGKSCPPGTFSDTLAPGKNICERGIFRNSLDHHAKLPCSSCHGPTHAIWPNPDPYANDNVTAMQLQGHTGTILECTACHTKDAFNKVESIGSTLNYPDKAGNPTILAGPHNTHPINDPNWVNKDGGFHNQWAKKPGLDGEDQCAACHGKDHKGTRLSKTPVDRVLTTGKTMKFKQITVKAGTPIGCDLCHDVTQSFKK